MSKNTPAKKHQLLVKRVRKARAAKLWKGAQEIVAGEKSLKQEWAQLCARFPHCLAVIKDKPVREQVEFLRGQVARSALKTRELGRPSGMGAESFMVAMRPIRLTKKGVAKIVDELKRKGQTPTGRTADQKAAMRIPVWVCFGPDNKPRSACVERPTRAELNAYICDLSKEGKLPRSSTNEKAKRLGYRVVKLHTSVVE